jgi:XRE family transcriptional regulator, regulator of sulfur utilization
MNIGTAIKSVRTQLGFSQEELSRKTGLSQTSISQIENGIKSPSKKSINKICQTLEVPEAVLYIIGIDNSDIPASRKEMFNDLYPQIKELAIQIIGKRKSKFISN